MPPRRTTESRILARIGQRLFVENCNGSCSKMAKTATTSLWNSNKSDTCGLPYFNCLHSRMMTIGWITNCHLSRRINTNDVEAPSAAAMRRVTGARSDETQSEIRSSSQCTGRRKGHFVEEIILEVTRRPNDHPSRPRESWTHATAGEASDVQRRWLANFNLKNMVVGIDTEENAEPVARQERHRRLSKVCWRVNLAVIVKTSTNANPDAESTCKRLQ